MIIFLSSIVLFWLVGFIMVMKELYPEGESKQWMIILSALLAYPYVWTRICEFGTKIKDKFDELCFTIAQRK